MFKSQKSKHLVIIYSFLFFLKLIASFLAGSIILLSDSLNNLAETLFRIKNKNVVILKLSIIIAVFFIAKTGFDYLYLFKMVENSFIIYVVEIVSIIILLIISSYLFKESIKFNSELLFVDSKKVIYDILINIVIIVSIYLNNIGLPFIYGTIIIIICFEIFLMEIKSLILLIKDVVSSPDKKIIQRIKEIIKNNPEVSDFKELRMKKSKGYIFGEVVIIFKKNNSIIQSQKIAEGIENDIKKEFSQVASFIINIKPNE